MVQDVVVDDTPLEYEVSFWLGEILEATYPSWWKSFLYQRETVSGGVRLGYFRNIIPKFGSIIEVDVKLGEYRKFKITFNSHQDLLAFILTYC